MGTHIGDRRRALIQMGGDGTGQGLIADTEAMARYSAVEQVDVAEEAMDEWRRWLVVHLGGSADLFDTAAVHQHHYGRQLRAPPPDRG